MIEELGRDSTAYRGHGKFEGLSMPSYHGIPGITAPVGYVADDRLIKAVNVALSVGQPLILTGEPGVGKTQLAYSVANELTGRDPLRFNVKTTSIAADLFYGFDALRRLQDAQADNIGELTRYIEFRPVGKGIITGMSKQARADSKYKTILPKELIEAAQERLVILIDEIDKAPRDLPNDVLNEVENLEFSISEGSETHIFKADESFRPFIIFTSNSEQPLPDAFLRRCTYFNIPFPSESRLFEIIGSRIKTASPALAEAAVKHVIDLRTMSLKKKPAVAELLGWVYILARQGITADEVTKKSQKLAASYSVLLKSKQDIEDTSLLLRAL